MLSIPYIAMTAALLFAFAAEPAASRSAGLEVDVALVLAGDASASMTPGDLQVQRGGFVAAFRHPDLLRAIRSGAMGRIAVTYVEWASSDEHWKVVPWMVIDNARSARAFADRLAAAPPVKGTETSISFGLLFAAGQFETSGVQATRAVIDVSGDGPNSVGPLISSVRDFVVAKGVTINGLPMASLQSDEGAYVFGPRDGIDLRSYYQDCVIGGPGAFIVPVAEPSQLVGAVQRKLLLEIAGLPARVTPAAFVTDGGRNTDCRPPPMPAGGS